MGVLHSFAIVKPIPVLVRQSLPLQNRYPGKSRGFRAPCHPHLLICTICCYLHAKKRCFWACPPVTQYSSDLVKPSICLQLVWLIIRYSYQVMHLSFVATPRPPPPPPHQPRDSRGNERFFYFCIVPTVRGVYQGFMLYGQKGHAVKWNDNRLRGKTSTV